MARVLIIDDSNLSRDTCRRFITKMGHEPIEAASGDDGVATAVRDSPDAIILDLLMPDTDGRDVLKTLREQQSTIPIIVITADQQQATRDACLALGAAEVINKYAEFDELERALERVLAGTQ